MTLQEKIQAMLDEKTPGCVNWTGYIRKDGYGQYTKWTSGTERKTWKAHRFIYERIIGPIPDGLELDHLCRNRKCVNPKHLEPVSRLTNVRRGISPIPKQRLQTHCKHGHLFDLVLIRKRKTGTLSERRECSICRKERNDRHYANRKALTEIEKEFK